MATVWQILLNAWYLLDEFDHLAKLPTYSSDNFLSLFSNFVIPGKNPAIYLPVLVFESF
jgi:hypothetical protein